MKTFKLSSSDINQIINGETEYEIQLTKKELEAVPNVKSVDELFAYFTAYESENGFLIHLEIEGIIDIFDQNSAGYVKLEIFEKEDIVVSSDESVTDIQEDRGEYDFYPTILALFYSAVPIRYSSKKLDIEKKDDYTLMSEEAYEQSIEEEEEESQKSNPFASLNPDEFDEE